MKKSCKNRATRRRDDDDFEFLTETAVPSFPFGRLVVLQAKK